MTRHACFLDHSLKIAATSHSVEPILPPVNNLFRAVGTKSIPEISCGYTLPLASLRGMIGHVARLRPAYWTPPMRSLILLSTLFATGLAAGQDKKTPPPPKVAEVVPPRTGKTETIALFDGKTLNGWEGYSDLWSVKDGLIVAKNTSPLKFSTYLHTKDNYTDFRLTFAAKLVESEMHSGVSFWGSIKPEVSKEPEKDRTKHTYAGHLVMFPSGWGMYDLFGRNSLPVNGTPAKKVGKQHDWNDIEILAQGNRVRVAVNGSAVVDWYDPEPERIKAGPIGLQLHSNSVPQEIHFKGLTLETFPKEDKLLSVK